MKKLAAKIYESVINPPSDEKLSKAREESGMALPTLWLLGKTGAGKSTIIQRLTGESAAVMNFQFTWPIWILLDGKLHFAVGNVFEGRVV